MHDHHVIIEAFNAIQSSKNMQTQPEFLTTQQMHARYLILHRNCSSQPSIESLAQTASGAYIQYVWYHGLGYIKFHV